MFFNYSSSLLQQENKNVSTGSDQSNNDLLGLVSHKTSSKEVKKLTSQEYIQQIQHDQKIEKQLSGKELVLKVNDSIETPKQHLKTWSKKKKSITTSLKRISNNDNEDALMSQDSKGLQQHFFQSFEYNYDKSI